MGGPAENRDGGGLEPKAIEFACDKGFLIVVGWGKRFEDAI